MSQLRARVLHAITRLDLGGAQLDTLRTVRALDPTRFDARLLTGEGGSLDEEARRTTNVTFCRPLVWHADPLRDAWALGSVAAHVRAHRRGGLPLIVHTHCSKAGVLGRIAAHAAGADRVIHTFHGLAYLPGRAGRQAFWAMERALKRTADALVFVSRRDMIAAERMGLLDGPRGVLIRAGIPFESFRHTPARRATLRHEVRSELGIPMDAPVIVTVANFKEVKKPLVALRAFASVAAAEPEARWLFVGGGHGAPLLAEVRARSLASRVHVLGWRRDVPRLLAASDVFLLSSDYEGMPCSALEALATGLPVVATNAGDVGCAVREGTGVLVDRGDDVGLAAGLRRMLVAPPDVAREATDVLREFDAAESLARKSALYDTLLREPRRRP